MTIPWTQSNAALEFCDRTDDLFDFSDDVQIALERDYYYNSALYTDKVLRMLAAYNRLLGIQSPSPDEVLRWVHRMSERP